MKSNAPVTAAFAVGLLACGLLRAQPVMRPPVLPQAIGTHLEQSRTLQQREAMAAEQARSSSAQEAAPRQESASPQKPRAKKARKAAKTAAAQ